MTVAHACRSAAWLPQCAVGTHCAPREERAPRTRIDVTKVGNHEISLSKTTIFFMSRAVFLAILATHFRDRMDLPKQKVPLGIRLRSRRRSRSRVRGPHGTGRTDLTAICAAEHQPIWAAHSSPTRRHVRVDKGRTGGPKGLNGGPKGWNGGPKGWNFGPERVERRTRTGGTADQDQNGWNGGPARREETSTFLAELRSAKTTS